MFIFGFLLRLFLVPAWSPLNAVFGDPIVGATGEVPVTYRRIQRHRLAVESQLPVGRCERRHDFSPASTAAAMNGSSVNNRHIENIIVEGFGNKLDEFMVELLH